MSEISRRSLLAAGSATLAASAVPALAAEPSGTAPSLKGKSILITGTSSGFGRLGALLYARSGAKVFATMRGLPRTEAVELQNIAKTEKLDLTVLPLDVTSDTQVAKAVATAEKLAGGALDVIVNNAGVVVGGPVELHDIESARHQFETNVLGAHRVARAALPAMRGRKAGLIVNVSSQQGRIIMPFGGLYAGTKFALEAISEQMAYELVPHGIEVVIIEPGGFPTNVGINRARYNQAVANRADPRHAAGYPAAVSTMKAPLPANWTMPVGAPDPMDVPRAIAEIIAMPAGSRPLRRPVHPAPKPQDEINRVARDTQIKLLGNGPYAAWAKAVLD